MDEFLSMRSNVVSNQESVTIGDSMSIFYIISRQEERVLKLNVALNKLHDHITHNAVVSVKNSNRRTWHGYHSYNSFG